MGEIRIVGPGKTRGYPYPVCKNELSFISLSAMNAFGWFRFYMFVPGRSCHCQSLS